MKKLEFSGDDLSPAKLEALGNEGDLEHLVIWGGNLTNDDLAPLAKLTSLTQLVLGEMRIDDGVFVHLRPLRNLETLVLAYTGNRGDMTPLLELPLRDIRLEGCRWAGDASATTLAKIPTLRKLEIHMTGLTDAGVAALASLPLETLWLGPRVTDAAMQVLAGIPTLRHLDICAHNVSDAGATALATLPNLEILWLARCGITDACVDALASQTGLRELNVNWTEISEQGMRRLRAALPTCRFPEPD